MNQSAGAAGRRVSLVTLNTAATPMRLVPGTTYGAYLWADAAYVPLAQEVLDIVPVWYYLASIDRPSVGP